MRHVAPAKEQNGYEAPKNYNPGNNSTPAPYCCVVLSTIHCLTRRVPIRIVFIIASVGQGYESTRDEYS